ncbi:hypothetical protein TanjilG_29026 [Lupinus angustifolius]|uniref:Uncharacterized protein n=1 Tax=Lupinus angustifolius TaxID=3871 RepID=A0A4P1RT88_LUPAN|nr:PREDICTED: uncharacterized protein LOC109363169 [Lupinus angustifolius]OIW17676.1 hypothetical protein TanjilG_29026 [Lupinus angustifolius]
MADLHQKLDALMGLVDVLNNIEDDQTEHAPPALPPKSFPTPTSRRNRVSGKYNNTGSQRIKGLSNQTGYTDGNANGAINFGNLNV